MNNAFQMNRAFLRSMHFFSRPVVPLAFGLLLANDFLLRRLWPSWWTGKLSDLTWLFIAPVALALFLSLFIPARWKRQEKWVAILAYIVTALAFTALKTLPAFHSVILHAWQSGLGFSAAVVMDPSDLLALAVLPISVFLWFAEKPASERLRLRAWLLLPLFALITVADSAMPNYGIACLSQRDSMLIASAGYSSFISQDGGLTWSEADSLLDQKPCYSPGSGEDISLEIPGAQLRASTGSQISISHDGGVSYEVEYRLASPSQAMNSYYLNTSSGNPVVKPGPLDAMYDPGSGNAIFAMGYQGVLVRKADASYIWVPVGNYCLPELFTLEAFFIILGGEAGLAAGLFFLLMFSWAVASKKSHWLLKACLVCLWLVWAVAALVAPARSSGYIAQFINMGLVGVLIISVLAGVYGLVILVQRHAWRPLFMAAACGLAFLVPYLFWYVNAIPNYIVVMIVAMVVALIGAITVLRDGFRLAKRTTA
jgi:hypothetical protein